MVDVQDRLEDIRARLVSISEELADLGIAALQTAIDEDLSLIHI